MNNYSCEIGLYQFIKITTLNALLEIDKIYKKKFLIHIDRDMFIIFSDIENLRIR